MAKDRMDRKELRQPDEFVTRTTGALEWAQQNRNTVLALGAGLLAIVIGVGFYNSQQEAQLRQSNNALSVAMAAFRDGNFADAAKSFAEVADQWQGSGIAPLAAVGAASAYLRSGDTDGAIDAATKIGTASLPPYVAQQRTMILANALAQKQDWSGAAAKFAEAASMDGPYTADALLGEARARAKNGEQERADEVYRQLIREYPERPDLKMLEARVS